MRRLFSSAVILHPVEVKNGNIGEMIDALVIADTAEKLKEGV